MDNACCSDELVVLAKDACKGARELILTMRQAYINDFTIPFEKKSSAVDPVTPIDKAAEKYIRDYILSHRPKDGIRGEEYDAIASDSGVEWIIDPIDGTVNFLYNIPAYSVSIGVLYQGEIIAGAVIDIAHDVLYFAQKNQGSYRLEPSSAQPIANVTHEIISLEQALLGTGFGYTANIRAQQGEIIGKILPQVRDIRRLGSAALDLCHVASGKLDCFYEYGLQPWDYAAGVLIAQEASAQVFYPAIDADFSVAHLVWAINPALQQAWQDMCVKLRLPPYLQA